MNSLLTISFPTKKRGIKIKTRINNKMGKIFTSEIKQMDRLDLSVFPQLMWDFKYSKSLSGAID